MYIIKHWRSRTVKEVGLANINFSPYVAQVTLQTDDMDLAGDVIQSLASYLGIEVCKLKVCCHGNTRQ